MSWDTSDITKKLDALIAVRSTWIDTCPKWCDHLRALRTAVEALSLQEDDRLAALEVIRKELGISE